MSVTSPLTPAAIRYLAMAAFTMVAVAWPAGAQDGPRGWAIVVSPENGIWSCSGSNPDAAFGCARRECRSEGEADCYRIAWCYPGGWGALYSQRTAEFHGPNGFCGAPSREEALATVERWCAAQHHVVSCYVSTLLTAEGTEEAVDIEYTFDR